MQILLIILACNFVLGILAYWVFFFRVFFKVKASLIEQAEDGDKIYTKQIIQKARDRCFSDFFGVSGIMSEEISIFYFIVVCPLIGSMVFIYNFVALIWSVLFSSWFGNLHTVVKKEKDFNEFLKEAENYDPHKLLIELKKRNGIE